MPLERTMRRNSCPNKAPQRAQAVTKRVEAQAERRRNSWCMVHLSSKGITKMTLQPLSVGTRHDLARYGQHSRYRSPNEVLAQKNEGQYGDDATSVAVKRPTT